MSKRLTTTVIFFFLLTVFVLAFFCYAIYSEVTITKLKSEVVTAQKTWINYFRVVNKVNSSELRYLVNSPNLINILKELNNDIQKDTENDINADLSNLEDYTYTKLSNDIDLIVVYSSDGIIRAGYEKDSDSIPFVNLPDTISQVLDGEKAALNINLLGKLYYVNIAPVRSGKEKLGAILIGKQINNGAAAYIQDLSGANLVVFSKDRLLASSLPYITAEKLFEQFRQIDPQMMQLISNSNPTNNSKVLYLNIDKNDFWAAGEFIADKTAGYLLLTSNSRWVRPYLAMKSKMLYIIPALLILCGLLSVILTRIAFIFSESVTTKASKTKEQIKTRSKAVNNKIDRQIDTLLDRVLCFFNMEFFKSNKELNDVSNSIYKMVKEYKAKVVVENFTSKNALGNIVNPQTRNDCNVSARKTTLYYSNVKEFNQLVEYFSPVRAFTLLSIYLKIQQEIIEKHNGKIVKQVDDRIIAAFESSRNAEDAIRSAFEIQNTIFKLSSVNPENIELSISISSGEALTAYMFDKVTYVGYAAKKANALCNEAPAGWVLIDKLTYDLAGIESLNAKQEMIAVKGILEPVQYYKFDPDTISNFMLNTSQEAEETKTLS